VAYPASCVFGYSGKRAVNSTSLGFKLQNGGNLRSDDLFSDDEIERLSSEESVELDSNFA
jgi:hypothetical protein